MKCFILLSLVAFAFAEQDCSANQHYDSCGTACPVTCRNFKNPPRVCVLMCNPGCHCDEGYVKADDGSCVLPENCPQESCGENEHYNGCGTACPLTCDNYDNPPKFCNLMCKIGCECDKGYVRSAGGRCVKPEHCPRKSDDSNCEDEADGGMCRGYFPMWYFDKDAETCKEFIYGGCQGNGNRYASKAECLKKCAIWESSSDVCDLPAETGVCRGYFPMYHYDKSSKQCKRFIYGGCGGNGNKFESVEECQKTCDNALVTDLKPTCEQEKKVGSCKAAFRRYFYNKESGECELFIYGGCQGNDNNFSSKEDCEAVCVRS